MLAQMAKRTLVLVTSIAVVATALITGVTAPASAAPANWQWVTNSAFPGPQALNAADVTVTSTTGAPILLGAPPYWALSGGPTPDGLQFSLGSGSVSTMKVHFQVFDSSLGGVMVDADNFSLLGNMAGLEMTSGSVANLTSNMLICTNACTGVMTLVFPLPTSEITISNTSPTDSAYVGVELPNLQRPTMTWAPETNSRAGVVMPSELATINSGQPISYRVVSTGTTGCAVNPGTGQLVFNDAGECTIQAYANGNDTWTSAFVNVTFQVDPPLPEQTVTFPGGNFLASDSPVVVRATTDGDGAITYVVKDAGTTLCTVEPATGELRFTNEGTCSVWAVAEETSNFQQGITSADFIIGLADPLLLWDPAVTNFYVTESPVTFDRASVRSGGAVTYSVDAADSDVCTVENNTLTLLKEGSCDVTAAVEQTGAFAADSKTITFQSMLRSQTVQWSPKSSLTLNDSPYTPNSASTNGGGSISYSLISSTDADCTVNPTTGEITFTAAGSCTVRATASAVTGYSAGTKDVVFAIERNIPTVAWNPDTTILATDTKPSALASTNSDGAITYAVTNPGTTGCTVNRNTGDFSFTGSGSCVITATAAATGSYAAGIKAVVFAVSLAPQVVTWPSRALTLADSPYSFPPATSNGPGTITYTVVSSGSPKCSINSSTRVLTFNNAGTCTIRANAAATGVWAAGQTTASYTITKSSDTGTNPTGTAGGGTSGTNSGSTNTGRPGSSNGSNGSGNNNPGALAKYTSLDPVNANTKMAAGRMSVLSNGRAIVGTKMIYGANGDKVTLNLGKWDLHFQTVSGNGKANKLGSAKELQFIGGQKVQISGNGYKPGTLVMVYFTVPAQPLGSLLVDDSGNINGTVTVPTDLSGGVRPIQVNGYMSDSSVRSATLAGTVLATAAVKKTVRVFFGKCSATLTPKGKKTVRSLVKGVPSQATGVTFTATGFRAKSEKCGTVPSQRATATVATADTAYTGTAKYVTKTGKKAGKSKKSRSATLTVTYTPSR